MRKQLKKEQNFLLDEYSQEKSKQKKNKFRKIIESESRKSSFKESFIDSVQSSHSEISGNLTSSHELN